MMKGANGEMKWNVRWPLPQSRAGRIDFVPALWYGIELLTLTALYFATGRIGLSLAAVSGFATLVWLPSGLSVAALFLWGFRLWPAIALGGFSRQSLDGSTLARGCGHLHWQYPGSRCLDSLAQTE